MRGFFYFYSKKVKIQIQAFKKYFKKQTKNPTKQDKKIHHKEKL